MTPAERLARQQEIVAEEFDRFAAGRAVDAETWSLLSAAAAEALTVLNARSDAEALTHGHRLRAAKFPAEVGALVDAVLVRLVMLDAEFYGGAGA